MRRALLSAVALLALAATPALAAPVQRTTLHAVEQQVMCVTCNIPLQVAESPAADDERAYIQQLVDRGDTLAEIKHRLVLEYGSTVLDLPPDHGFNVVFYILPIVGGLAAIAILAVLVPRWRRRGGSGPRGGDPAPSLSPEDTARLDADLAHYT